jgi:hypothetical protein
MPGPRIDLKSFRKRAKNDPPAEPARFDKVLIDGQKIDHYRRGLDRAIENYNIFQNFSFFRWPLWIHQSPLSGRGPSNSLMPPLLINASIREGIRCSNFLSMSHLFIDPSGMICPSYERWSIEVWTALVRIYIALLKPLIQCRS